MKKRLLLTSVLIAYCAILIKVMVLKDVPLIRIGSLMINFGGTATGQPNFMPFRTILQYLLGEMGLMIAGINLVGNIGLLVPIGFLVPFVLGNMTWRRALVLAVAAGLTIEVLQVVLRVGIFDVDDVILNALGVMIGYAACAVLSEWVRSRKHKRIAVAAALIVVVAASAFYAVYPTGQQSVNRRFGAARNGDLCNGTGGTGQVVSVGQNEMAIRRNDGVVQTIALTSQTMIRTSAGPSSESALRTGDRVTVVIDASETATTVLVCGVPRPKTKSGQ